MKRILFPTDFSETAGTAFLYALRLADVTHAELIILHVYDLPIVDAPPLPDSTQEIFDIVEMNQFESFREQLPELHKIADGASLGHISMRSILLYGDLVYNINKVCKDENVSLIVMGTKGASGLKETFMGSTTASVISGTPIPVLAVPAGAAYTRISTIAFTTQYHDKDSEAMQSTLELADAFGATVKCLHIETQDGHTETEERISEWKMYFKGRNVSFYNIAGDDVEHTLLEFAEQHRIDILVMRAHKRGFFENLFHRSLTKKMAYHTAVPLLIYHEN